MIKHKTQKKSLNTPHPYPNPQTLKINKQTKNNKQTKTINHLSRSSSVVGPPTNHPMGLISTQEYTQ